MGIIDLIKKITADTSADYSPIRIQNDERLARKNRTRGQGQSDQRINTLLFSTCSLVFHSVSSPFELGALIAKRQTHRTTQIQTLVASRCVKIILGLDLDEKNKHDQANESRDRG